MVDAGRLGRGRQRAAPADFPARLSQLRHDLRAAVGAGNGARDEPRRRRGPPSHAAPAGGALRAGHDPTRRWRDRPDDGGRLSLAGTRRIPRLSAGLALVRPADRRRRRADRPHPRALPLERSARLCRPSLHRPGSRRAGGRDQAPEGRLARPRPSCPGGPAPSRGLALLARLPRLPAARGPEACPGRGASSSPPMAPRSSPSRSQHRSSGRSSTGSPPGAPPTRSPARGRRSKRWNDRPGRSTWSSTGRVASARCCSGRG